MLAPLHRSWSLPCALLLATGCLNNPTKPADGEEDDAGFAAADALVGGLGPALDTAAPLPTDARPGGDLGSPPDGGGGGGAEAGPDLAAAPDLATDASCVPACAAGARRCGPGGGVQTCAANASGCLAWGSETACGANSRCAGAPPSAACACNPAPAGCTAAGSYCRDASTVGVCLRDSDGCFQAGSATTTCPASQACGGAAPNAACGCNNTCAASQVGTYCADSKTVATCTASNGCYVSSGATACTGHRTCQAANGAASCQCPAAGTAPGTSCPTAGATVCAGALVLTCTADGAGCAVWTQVSDCAALAGGPFVCGTGGGSPACQCPDPAAGQVYVDPVGGRDEDTPVAPNGAMSPPACRYRTLTRALGAATAARNRVTALTASPPATFSGETFPLMVPAGVTLGTADSTPTPGNYVIQFGGSTGAGLVLAGGSTLEGFLVQATGGTAATATVTCASGAVTIRSTHVLGPAASKTGTGIAIGRAVADTCTGTVEDVQVRGFRTGLSVTTAATAPLVIRNSTLRDNGAGALGAGLLVAAGAVTATDLIVSRSPTGTAAFGVVLDAAAATAAPALTATNLRLVDLTQIGLDLRQQSGMAAPSAVLTGGDIEAGGTTEPGVRASAGTLSVTGARIHDAGSDGLRVVGAAVTLGAGTQLDANGRDGIHLDSGSVTGTGVAVTANDGNALAVAGGQATLHRTNLSNNGVRGLLLSAGAVVIDDGSAIKSNGRGTSRWAGIRVNGGTLTLGGATGEKVDVADNGNEGLAVLPTATATVTVTRALIHGSGTEGVRIDLPVAGSAVTITDTDVNANLDGVRVVRAPAAAGHAVSLTGVRVFANGRTGAGGVGVALGGDAGSVAAALAGCTIRDNRDHGVLIQQGAGHITTASLEDNDLYGNNTGAGRPAGGLFLATSSTLAAFSGNKVHGNTGDEIGVGAPPNGGDTWNLGGAAACTAPNQVYCYGAGAVGLRILSAAPAGTKVNAENLRWTNLLPAKGTDFDFADASHAVAAIPACTPVVATCN
jgi:hypothetical protein